MNNIIPLRAGESVDLGSFEIVKYENGIYEFAGLSEDIGKLPVVDAVKSGSNAYCIDTGEVFMYEKSSNSWFKQPSNGTNETVVQSLSVTENGSYNAGTGKAYNPVTVNVPEKTVTPLEVTANGTYDAGNNAAYNPIVVNVPQEGGGSGGGDFIGAYSKYTGRGYCFWVCSSKDMAVASYTENEQDYNIPVVDSHCIAVSGSINVEKFNITFTDGQKVELDTITDVSY